MKSKKIIWFAVLVLILSALLVAACGPAAAPTVDTAAVDAANEAAANAQATADAALAALEAAAEGDEQARADLEAQLEEAQAALKAAEGAAAEAEAAAEAAVAELAAAGAASEGPAELVDIKLWAQATVTEAGPPPDDWVAYDLIRDELGINLDYVIIPPAGDGEAKLNAAAASNTLPDLFQITTANRTEVRNALYRFYELGLLAPVDDLMPLMPERVKTHYNDPLLLDLVTFDGQQYGLPEPPAIPKREGLVIRKDWLDNLGLEPPTTLAELFDVAKAFTEQDPDGNGENDTYGIGAFIEGPGVGRRFNYILGAYGVPGVWNFDPATFGLNVRDARYPEAIAFLKKIVDEKVVDPDWPTLKKDEFRARWKQGKFGIMWEDFAALTNKSNYTPFDENFPEAEWIPLPAPTGPNGDAFYDVYVGTGQIFAISTNAAKAGKGEAIARLLEWMATDGYYLLGFGQEGVNFILDEDGNISTEGLDPTQAYSSPEQQPFTQLRNQLIFYNAPVEVNARYPNYETVNGRLMEPTKTFLGYFQEQPWVDGRAVQAIPAPANAADFDRFYSEGIIQFVLGQKELNENTWAEYLAGLDGVGAQEYEASAKQALEEAGLLK